MFIRQREILQSMALYSRRTKFKTAKGLIKTKSAIPRLGEQGKKKKKIEKPYLAPCLPKERCDLNKIMQTASVCT